MYREKSYLCGQSLLCDAIALWGKTVVPWAATPVPEANDQTLQPSTFGLLLVAAVLASVALCITMIVRISKLLRDPDVVRPRGPITMGIAAIQLLLILLWLFTPLLGSIQVLLLMVITVLLENMSLRPKILAQRMHKSPTLGSKKAPL